MRRRKPVSDFKTSIVLFYKRHTVQWSKYLITCTYEVFIAHLQVLTFGKMVDDNTGNDAKELDIFCEKNLFAKQCSISLEVLEDILSITLSKRLSSFYNMESHCNWLVLQNATKEGLDVLLYQSLSSAL